MGQKTTRTGLTRKEAGNGRNLAWVTNLKKLSKDKQLNIEIKWLCFH